MHVLSALTLRLFWIRRMQLSEFMSSNHSLNTSRYIRLMLLAIMDMMCTVPVSIYCVYIGNRGIGLAPWISWSNVHYNFSNIELFPAIIWRGNPTFQTSVELTRWLYPAAAFIFFALFGFATEAQKNYRAVFWCIAKCFGFDPTTTKGQTISSGMPE
jgi:pheromone a factor receptor